jgi:hypothetical protein
MSVYMSHDLMLHDVVYVCRVDGTMDMIVVNHVHWAPDCVEVWGYSPWHDYYGHILSLPFNYEVEIWNGQV